MAIGCAVLCATLFVSLCAPGLRTGIPAPGNEHSVRILDFAVSSSTVLVTKRSLRLDHARQRPSSAAPFVLVVAHRPGSGRGRFAKYLETARRQSLGTAKAPSGRSPPNAIS